MKRRKFLLTSGTALLGSTALTTTQQQPAIALNFDLIGTENIQPSKVNSILINFQNFELIPKYVDETSEDATITITLDVNGFESIKNKTNLSLQNGETKNKSDLGSAVPIVLDEINTSKTALDGKIKINIEHPSISDSYAQSFTITEDTLQNGLVGYWPLHEWRGRANDLSGNQNHGTVNGAIQGVVGNGGLTSYRFNGNESVTYPTYSFSSSDTFSLSFWFRPTFDTNGSNNITSEGNWHSFVGVKNNSFRWWHEDHGALNTPVSTVQPYRWYHGVITYSSDGREIWLDGDLHDTDNITESFDWSNIGSDGGWGYWNGEISNFRIYNRQLSSSEINKLYNIGITDRTDTSLHNGSDSGAVSRWKFNSNINDSWGSLDGTIQNNATVGQTDSISNGSAKFGTDNDAIQIGDHEILDKTEFTISAWVNPNNFDGGDRVFEKFDSKDNTGYYLSKTSNGYAFRTANGSDIRAGFLSNTNSWVHLVAVRDSTGVKIYCNGVLMDKSSGSYTESSSGEVAYIGNDQTGTRGFNGKIDDVRFYNRPLNTKEVQQLYQWGTRGKDLRKRTTTKNKSDIAGWWKLNETSGSIAYDSSGKDNDATINGAGPDGAGTIQDPTGQTAYLFNSSSSDNVTGTYPNGASANFTYAFWFNIRDSSDLTRQFFKCQTGSDSSYIRVNLNDTDSDSKPEVYLDLRTNGEQNVEVSTTESIKKNKWYHFVITRDTTLGDGRNGIFTYLNGAKDKQITRDQSPSQTDLGLSGYNFKIGSSSDSAISDFRIYDRPITPQEVSYLYEQKF